MAHFQIFVPTSMPPEVAGTALGLLFRRGDSEPRALPTDPGPDGGRGVVLTWSQTGGSGYCPERQTWKRAEGLAGVTESEYWIGFDKLSPTTPADLARAPAVRLKGIHARLLDGNEWTVPSSTLLPHRFRLRKDGRAKRVLAPEAEGAAQLSKWADDALDSVIFDGKEIPLAGCLRIAVPLLAANYRVNFDICRILGLFDAHTTVLVLALSGGRLDLLIELFGRATGAATDKHPPELGIRK